MTRTELYEIKDLIDSGVWGEAATLCEAHGVSFEDVEARCGELEADESDDGEEDETIFF